MSNNNDKSEQLLARSRIFCANILVLEAKMDQNIAIAAVEMAQKEQYYEEFLLASERIEERLRAIQQTS